MIVLDANAAIAIVSGSPEGSGCEALILKGEKIIAPELFRYELLNVVRKYVKSDFVSRETARCWFEAAMALVDEFCPLGDMGVEVLNESLATGHPSYDISYLVLARRTGSTLVTLDKRLVDVCIKRDVNCVEEVSLTGDTW